MVFARGRHEVRLWDQDASQVQRALEHIARTLPEMAGDGLIDDPEGVRARISGVGTLAEALDGAGFVQENIAERAEPKQRLFAEVESLAPPDAILSAVQAKKAVRPVTPEAYLLYGTSRLLPQVLRSTARGKVV